jgi:hypothetical protein
MDMVFFGVVARIAGTCKPKRTTVNGSTWVAWEAFRTGVFFQVVYSLVDSLEGAISSSQNSDTTERSIDSTIAARR